MTTVIRVPLELKSKQIVSVPRGALILDAQLRQENLVVWVVGDTTLPLENREFAIYFTGEPVPTPLVRLDYIASIQIKEVGKAAHLFEVRKGN